MGVEKLLAYPKENVDSFAFPSKINRGSFYICKMDSRFLLPFLRSRVSRKHLNSTNHDYD
jgi:hypothetical protein